MIILSTIQNMCRFRNWLAIISRYSSKWKRMDNLPYQYHTEGRKELEIADLTILVVRPLLVVDRSRLDISDIKGSRDLKHLDSHELVLC